MNTYYCKDCQADWSSDDDGRQCPTCSGVNIIKTSDTNSNGGK